MFRFLKDILAPKKCYSCNKEGRFLCPECLSKIEAFEDVCYVCKGKTNNFEVHNNCLKEVSYDKIIIMSHYKNKHIKKLIKDLKFYKLKDISEDFGYYLSELFFENEIYKNTNDYILIYPPMSFLKKLEKGYNHSELLTSSISKNTKINISKGLIKKTKTTRQQSKLSKSQRIKNLEKAFKINKNKLDKIDNKTFIIVDDIVSTGTTINEIAKVLKKNGAKKVIGLVVASD